MKTGKEIFEYGGKGVYAVPDGYFDDLKNRLSEIPSRSRRIVTVPGIWQKTRPYFALAASFLIAVVVGNTFLKSSMESSPDDLSYSDILYSDIMSSSLPEPFYVISETEDEELDEEDLINYLIESGATENHLAYIASLE